jgi:osmotically-inducible protein OsmY
LGLREDTLARYREDESASSIALTAAAGFAVGLLAGVVAGEFLGDINAERFKRGIRRMGGGDKADQAKAMDPTQLERTVVSVLKRNSSTRALNVAAHALGNGILELTGTAPDERTRELATEVARAVRGVLIVVNRVLVQGIDVPVTPLAPRPGPA